MNPKVGIIGGSGLYKMDGVEIVEEKSIETPYGKPSDVIRLGTLDGVEVAFLPRHGRHHAITPSEINYRANVWALKSLGIEQIIGVSAVGSMREEIEPGHLILIDQCIDRTRQRPSTFFENGCVAHVSFADPICTSMGDILYQMREAANTTVHRGGTYVCIEGPMFSTRAESQLFRSWGVDVIGMTNYQESKLAREAEICYATVALATDYDCWRSAEESCEANAIFEMMKRNVINAQSLIRAAIGRVAERSRDCGCGKALATALITQPEHIPEPTAQRLAPIIGKYIS